MFDVLRDMVDKLALLDGELYKSMSVPKKLEFINAITAVYSDFIVWSAACILVLLVGVLYVRPAIVGHYAKECEKYRRFDLIDESMVKKSVWPVKSSENAEKCENQENPGNKE